MSSRLTSVELVAVLSSSVGEEVARESIAQAAAALGIPQGSFTQEQALAILGRVAESDGLVGVTARFARSRLMLKWPASEHS